MKNSIKQLKISGLFIYILLACLFVYFIKPTYIVNLLIVYLPPSIITFYWLKKSRKKILIFSLVTTTLFAIPIELASRLANVWDVASIFPRLFSVAPIENLFYAFINFFWPLCFYEYFIDHDKDKNISSKWKYLVALYCFFSIIIYSLYFYDKNYAAISYWIVGLVALLIPSIIIYSKNKKIIKKVITPTIFFGSIFCIHEITSIAIGHWWWPGNYLLPLNINGITFPLDDAIIWYLLSTPALIGGYEFFMDDYQ